jgi:hypothetical protein
MATSYRLLPRVQRSVRMAFLKAKAQIPVDTGTLRSALVATKMPYGYHIHFINERVNPKSKARVGVYKDPVNVRGKSAGYWNRFRQAFYADLGNQLHSRVHKGGK